MAVGGGSIANVTDFAVNANQATTTNSANTTPALIVVGRKGMRRAVATPAALGLKAIGVIATSATRPLSRATSSRSGGAVSPAVTTQSRRAVSAWPLIAQVMRARSN